MRNLIRRAIICAIFFSLAGCALDQAVKIAGGSTANQQPSEGLIAAGLKEALQVGTERAVSKTSRSGGFLDNPLLKIALPEQLNSAIDTLRAVGLGGLVDSFETTLNRAAEKASGEATPVFVDAVKSMTLADVYGVFRGGPTAATEYFRERTSGGLKSRFKPIIDQSLAKVGGYGVYKDLITPYQQLPFTSGINLDLADYVTDQTLNGLFKVLGDEEAKIRSDPIARTTALLRQVFGS